MKAAFWYGPEDLRLIDAEIPQLGPSEVLVKIGVALTCGTDFKFFRRGHAVLAKTIPAPFGHEMAGTITAVAPDVQNFKIGDRVVASNSAPCGSCFFCLKDQMNLCENLEFLNGAFAEYIRIPRKIVEKNLYKLPDRLAFRDAASAEPLAAALHAIEQLQIMSGEVVCIIGSGPGGLMLVQLAKLKGARVICLARNSEKLELAQRLGADHIVSTLKVKDIQKEIREMSNGGRGPDIVIEAAGQPSTWELAVSLVRKGGRVSFYGGCQNDTSVTLDTHKIHYEQLQLSGVFHHTPHYFFEALNLIATGKIKIAPLIENEKRLSEITQVFRRNTQDTPLKVAIVP
ncbi:MAG: zinc-binding dehydrogenase [Deltaproteobacteria bacterium]|nr:zinc-binding dehydrogenase [Deltaproteobacteria bacterium]